jgi:LysR family transcriptional regulator, glycine cleavage system transcriptional activator
VKSIETTGRNLPSVTAMRAFDAVCRTGSMNAAAGELNVTTGAISRQIKTLEEELGVQLFRRGNSNVKLTSFGETFRDAVVPAFDRIESSVREVRDLSRVGPLTVACLPSFIALWLLPRLHRFAQFDPQTELRIVSLRDREIDWQTSQIDAVVDVGRWPVKQDLIQTSFMQDSPGLVTSPKYWAGLGTSASGEATLQDATFISVRSRPHLWESWSSTAGVVLPEHYKEFWVDHLFLAIEAARNGLGLVPAPLVYSSRFLEDGSLLAPFGFVEKSVPYYLAWPRERSGDRRVNSLKAWLRLEGAAAGAL